MKQGKITKVISGKFFFIDNDYWCHNNNYDKEPHEGDIVEYEPIIKNDGKKFANNVVFVRSKISELDEYFIELEKGYFRNSQSFNLEPLLIIKYPKQLARLFQSNPSINKSAQIRKYFDTCRLIEGKLKINNDFNYVKSELLKLIPLLNNAQEKGHISKEFYNFLEKNIEMAIISKEHFTKGFMPHFEAIIGFYKH